MTELEAKVRAIIADTLGVKEEDVRPEVSLANDLGADSLDIMELIMKSENEFGILIPDELAEKIETVADVIEYLKMNCGNTYSISSSIKPKENRMRQLDIQKCNNAIKQK